MKRRFLPLLLCLLALLSLAACGERDDSAGTPLVFREGDGAFLFPKNLNTTQETLTPEEVSSILTGDAFRDLEGAVLLSEDDTLSRVELYHLTESRKGSYMVMDTLVSLYPAALPMEAQPTCEISGTAVDAFRWESNGAECFTAAFIRPDTNVAVCATAFCTDGEGERRQDTVARLWALTEACLNGENTLTLDSVYSGPDFPRQSETALVPLSLETEAALRAGAGEAMERYQADCALDEVIPAECACDAMVIRAVSPECDEMLLDARMAYLPAHWDFSDVDDGYRFPGDTIPAWYSGQTILRRGEGERSECLVGTVSFRVIRSEDGAWQMLGATGGKTAYWLDSGSGSEYAGWTRVRWTV